MSHIWVHDCDGGGRQPGLRAFLFECPRCKNWWVEDGWSKPPKKKHGVFCTCIGKGRRMKVVREIRRFT